MIIVIILFCFFCICFSILFGFRVEGSRVFRVCRVYRGYRVYRVYGGFSGLIGFVRVLASQAPKPKALSPKPWTYLGAL